MSLRSFDKPISKKQAEVGDGFWLRWLGYVFWRRRWLVVFVVLLGTSLSALLGYVTPQQYRATSLIFVKPRPDKVLEFETVTATLSAELVSMQTQLETSTRMITAHDHLDKVASQIGQLRPDLIPDVAIDAFFQSDRPAREPHISPVGLVTRDTTLKGAEGDKDVANMPAPDLQRKDKHAAILNALRAGLSVSPQSNSQLIGVTFTSVDPVKSADIANLVAEHFVSYQLAQKRATTTRVGNELSARVAELEVNLRQKEAILQKHRETHNLWGEATEDTALRHIDEIDERLLAAAVDLEVATSQTRIRAERDLISERISKLKLEKREAERALLERHAAVVRLAALEGDVNAARRIYEAVRQRLFEVREEEHLVTADVEIVSAAVAPADASSPSVVLITVMGFIASSMVAATLAIAIEHASAQPER